VGARFDTDTEDFALSVDLGVAHPEWGVSVWGCGADPDHASRSPNSECAVFMPGQGYAQRQVQWVGFQDVNGDGLLDRVVGTQAYLGMYAGSPTNFSSAYITLPGLIGVVNNTHDDDCLNKKLSKSISTQVAGLRDLTGDGIPDYYSDGQVWIGTGTGFVGPINVVSSGGQFQFSHQTETCDGKSSLTDGGLYDLDGDGKPEIIGVGDNKLLVTHLVAGSVAGAPNSGRLTNTDNGYGAKTNINYVSAKNFAGNAVPFPEIVVGAVSTTGNLSLGGSFAGSTYAYGNGELIFDSWLDRFAFPGYGRQVEARLLATPTSNGFPQRPRPAWRR
jgi:hypothetical protein